MGIAAYNRGTAAGRIRADRELNSQTVADLEVIERLNAVPKRVGAARMFCDVIVRHQEGGAWWVMSANSRVKGWGAYGFRYADMAAVMADNQIKITGYGRDDVSFYYTAKPCGVKEA